MSGPGLPAASSAWRAGPEKGPLSPFASRNSPVSTRKPRLLIADDHEMVSQGIKALLGDAYVIVDSVRDGREVVSAVARHQPDVLLLDLSLPHRTGIDLIPEIRALHPDTRILVVTMHVDQVLAGVMRLCEGEERAILVDFSVEVR